MAELTGRALDARIADLRAQPCQYLAVGVVDDTDQMFHRTPPLFIDTVL
ncbi:hypothetical protein BURMUCGD1_4640 [Burkholderia multivorans CGD1]|nr:hypothetical protein BURMUCGD1_4640 [Burkholderia multivorans CGD1]